MCTFGKSTIFFEDGQVRCKNSSLKSYILAVTFSKCDHTPTSTPLHTVTHTVAATVATTTALTSTTTLSAPTKTTTHSVSMRPTLTTQEKGDALFDYVYFFSNCMSSKDVDQVTGKTKLFNNINLCL